MRVAAQALGNLCSAIEKPGSAVAFRKQAQCCTTGSPIRGREPKGLAGKQMIFCSSMMSKVLRSSSPKGWSLHAVPCVTSPCSQMSAYEVRLNASHVPDEAVRLCPNIPESRAFALQSRISICVKSGTVQAATVPVKLNTAAEVLPDFHPPPAVQQIHCGLTAMHQVRKRADL